MPLVQIIERIPASERQKLIAEYLVPDPHHPGVAHFRLHESGVSAWALAAYYETVGHDRSRVARDYDVSEEQVRAALAFYVEHADAIDTYLSPRPLR